MFRYSRLAVITLQQLTLHFLISFLVLSSVVSILQLVRASGYFLGVPNSFSLTFQLVGFTLIRLFPLIILFTFTYSIITTFHELRKNNEYTALQNLGVSPKILLLTSVVFSMLAVFWGLWAHLTLVPNAQNSASQAIEQLRIKSPEYLIKKQTFTHNIFNSVFYVNDVNTEEKS